jgi:hypothetical protein
VNGDVPGRGLLCVSIGRREPRTLQILGLLRKLARRADPTDREGRTEDVLAYLQSLEAGVAG